MTDWATIEPRFVRLRDFVLNDLEGFGQNKEGGNFALVGLVLTACDALGSLFYASRGAGWRVFQRCLPDPWKPVAKTLYEALRNGLIHDYDAKVIVDETTNVSFAIGWYRQHDDLHMQFLTGERRVLYIQAQRLVASLREAFAEIEAELRADAGKRDAFLMQDGKDRVVHVNARDRNRWRTAVSQAKVARETSPPGTPTFGTASAYFPVGATGAMTPLPPDEERES